MSLTETQEQILDAALTCIVRDGVDGTSLRDVAREADVSLGLLGYHFDDRKTLLVAAFELATERLLDTSLDAIDGIVDPVDRATAFIRGAFHPDYLNPDYLALRTALWAISRIEADIGATEAQLYRRYRAQMIELLAEARPAFDASEVEDRATDVIVTQNGLWLNWARYQNERDLERGLARCESLALD